MKFRISGLIAFAFALASQSGAATPNLTTLVSFCLLPNCVDGLSPEAALIADANGNLFGTTGAGGAMVFEGGEAAARCPRSSRPPPAMPPLPPPWPASARWALVPMARGLARGRWA
jgi:hypothetical protein